MIVDCYEGRNRYWPFSFRPFRYVHLRQELSFRKDYYNHDCTFVFEGLNLNPYPSIIIGKMFTSQQEIGSRPKICLARPLNLCTQVALICYLCECGHPKMGLMQFRGFSFPKVIWAILRNKKIRPSNAGQPFNALGTSLHLTS